VGAALTGQRTLGPAEARVAGGGGIALLALAIVALLWPRLVAVPFAALALWLGATLLLRGLRLKRQHRADRRSAPGAVRPRREAARPGAS
jgi:cardiolipin synthase